MADSLLSFSIDDYISTTAAGSLDRATYNNLQGLNYLRTPGALRMVKDRQPLTFFVRPQLNMQRDNIRNVRQLSALLSNVPQSIQTYIRCLLDPRLNIGAPGRPAVPCPVIDNAQAFIPFLTNNLTSMSPWPSVTVPTFTSKPGLYNESYFMVDGRVLNSETWDMSIGLRNVDGDVALLALYVWTLYMGSVAEGKLVPYLDFITENELDYCSRCYSIVLRPDMKTISKFAANYVGVPTGISIGEAFGISGDKPFSEANSDLSVTFKCAGVDYFDPILIKEFNATVAIFNPNMGDDYRAKEMMKVPDGMREVFNNRPYVYPYIDIYTKTLDWYVPVELFTSVGKQMLDQIPEANGDNETGD